MKIAIVSFASLIGFLAVFTWWALESSGVAVIETRASDGSLRSTHVWFVEPNGELWLEAGTPENPWYLDILRNPRVSFSSAQQPRQYSARRVEEPGAQDRIRSLLRKKYGVRDRWIDLIFDTSRSVAVRLVPPGGESPVGAATPR